MKKYRRDVLDFTKASVVTSMGASVAPGAGMAALSSQLPVMGSAIGASTSLRLLNGMTRKRRR